MNNAFGTYKYLIDELKKSSAFPKKEMLKKNEK